MFVEYVLAEQKSEIEDGMPGVIWKKTRSSREREGRTDVCHTVSVFVFVFVSPLLKWWTPKAARWARKRSTLCFLLIVTPMIDVYVYVDATHFRIAPNALSFSL